MGTIMLIRLYRNALFCLFAAVVVLWVFGSVIPGRMAGSTMLGPLGDVMAKFSLWVTLVLLAAGILITAFQSYSLWRWHIGKSAFCHNCGGIVEERLRRHKAYDQCLACGHKQPVDY